MSHRAVVVTGASSGIGRTTALLLARQGWLVLGSVRSADDGAALSAAAAAVGVGDQVEALRLEVTDEASVAAFAQQVRERLTARGAHLVGLVNNAGIVVAGPIEEVPLARLRAVLEVNVVGVVAVTQALLPLLRLERGRVINISSVAGRVASPFLGPYAASKFALEALSDSLRVELRPWGIAVVLIEPGPIVTPFWAKGETETLAERADLPDRSPYAASVAALAVSFRRSGQRGLPPERVAEAISSALTVPRPQARYLVARTGWVFEALARFIPTRLRDRLIARGRSR